MEFAETEVHVRDVPEPVEHGDAVVGVVEKGPVLLLGDGQCARCLGDLVLQVLGIEFELALVLGQLRPELPVSDSSSF